MHNPTLLRDANEKFLRGDTLTDEELKALAKTYRDAQKALWAIFNRSYDLVENDLNRRATQLEDIIKARRERNA